MVRAPCCEKMGLKKGPWTAEEDEILIAHIEKHGHGNWRALPKQSGLLRCGKSCRLRWMNYLRPDIKRGSFTVEEEEMIIALHEKLGNRWSVIASRLPGRTDNEIKNVWHTHLKKRLNPTAQEPKKKKTRCYSENKSASNAKRSKLDTYAAVSRTGRDSMISSPAPSCSDFSCITESCSMSGETATDLGAREQESFSSEEFPEIDESFWTEALYADGSLAATESPAGCDVARQSTFLETLSSFSSSNSDDMDFWLDVFIESGGLQDAPSF